MATPITWLASCLVGGATLYLLLLPRRPVISWLGGGLGSLSLLLLWMAMRSPIVWWSQLFAESTAASPLFVVCGLAAVAAAVMAVTVQRPSNSIVWLVATLVCVAALCAMHDAQFLAASTILIAGGGSGTLLLLVAQRMERAKWHEISRLPREPLLACLCGSLLVVGLMGAFQYALAGESLRDSERMPRVVTRWNARGNAPAGHRPVSLGQSRAEPLGTSLFKDHWLAIVLLAVLLFVSLVVALSLIPVSMQPGETKEAIEVRR